MEEVVVVVVVVEEVVVMVVVEEEEVVEVVLKVEVEAATPFTKENDKVHLTEYSK